MGLIKHSRILTRQLKTNQSTAVYSVGEQTCTVGTTGTSSPLYILTREINCREEEEEEKRVMEMTRGEMSTQPGGQERKELKENTGKMNWQHGGKSN